MRSTTALLVVLAIGIDLGVGQARAASTPPAVRSEIDALLAALRSSGCEFQRNGSWHGAADASDHLLRKLDGVERRTTLTSTERFIELAATRSSVSGSPYKVRCPGQPVTDSAVWLGSTLRALRSGDRPAMSPAR